MMATKKTTGAKKVRLKLFLQSSALDFALVLTVSVALTFTVSYGFDSATSYRGNVLLIAAVTVPLLIALFAGSWSKRALVPSSIAVVVLAIVLIAGSVAAMPEGVGLFTSDGTLNDVDENYAIFAFVLVIVPIVVYLLSRRTAGLVVLLVSGVLSCGVIQFLYRDWISGQPGLLAAVIVIFGIAMMFIYQCYRQSVYSAKRAKRTSFLGAFGFSALVSATCLLVGVAVFYGIVANLGLTTPEIKPFERYWARPVVEYTGTFDEQQVESEEQTTDDTNENNEDSNQDAEGGNQSSDTDGVDDQSSGTTGGLAQILSAFDATNWDQDYNSISYQILQLTALIVAILLIVLFIGAILLQRYRRVWRLKRIAKYPHQYRVWYLCTFLVGRFHRLKIRKADHLTPMEFALATQRTMMPFDQNTDGVDFIRVTDIYQRVCYGGYGVTTEEYGELVRYYTAFFGNARKRVGKLKWIWKFWRI